MCSSQHHHGRNGKTARFEGASRDHIKEGLTQKGFCGEFDILVVHVSEGCER